LRRRNLAQPIKIDIADARRLGGGCAHYG
jgi:hypothetical protein